MSFVAGDGEAGTDHDPTYRSSVIYRDGDDRGSMDPPIFRNLHVARLILNGLDLWTNFSIFLVQKKT